MADQAFFENSAGTYKAHLNLDAYEAADRTLSLPDRDVTVVDVRVTDVDTSGGAQSVTFDGIEGELRVYRQKGANSLTIDRNGTNIFPDGGLSRVTGSDNDTYALTLNGTTIEVVSAPAAAGGGVTNTDRQMASATAETTTTSTTYVDLASITLTTNNLGEAGNYVVTFSADLAGDVGTAVISVVINYDGVDQAETERTFTLTNQSVGDRNPMMLTWLGTGITSGKVIKVRWKTTAATIASAFTRTLVIDGTPASVNV